MRLTELADSSAGHVSLDCDTYGRWRQSWVEVELRGIPELLFRSRAYLSL